MAEDVPIFQTMVMENPNPEGSARLVRLVRARSEQGKEQRTKPQRPRCGLLA